MWRMWPFPRQLKLNFLRFIRLRGTPDEVARGTALGIGIGMTPTMGFQMPIALFFAWILRENKLAAVLGVWITNPITAPFIYALEYETGRLLLGMPRLAFPTEMTWAQISQLGWQFLVPLCFGSLIYTIICAFLAYALTLRFIPSLRRIRVPRWPRRRRRVADSDDDQYGC